MVSPDFTTAASAIKNIPPPETQPNFFYSLYKQATVGAFTSHEPKKTWHVDIVGNKKSPAWKKKLGDIPSGQAEFQLPSLVEGTRYDLSEAPSPPIPKKPLPHPHSQTTPFLPPRLHGKLN